MLYVAVGNDPPPVRDTVIAGQLIVRLYVGPVPEQPFASVAVTVIGKEPVCVGVPERTPVDGLSPRPLGKAPLSDQVIVPVPPDCVKV